MSKEALWDDWEAAWSGVMGKVTRITAHAAYLDGFEAGHGCKFVEVERDEWRQLALQEGSDVEDLKETNEKIMRQNERLMEHIEMMQASLHQHEMYIWLKDN